MHLRMTSHQLAPVGAMCASWSNVRHLPPFFSIRARAPSVKRSATTRRFYGRPGSGAASARRSVSVSARGDQRGRLCTPPSLALIISQPVRTSSVTVPTSTAVCFFTSFLAMNLHTREMDIGGRLVRDIIRRFSTTCGGERAALAAQAPRVRVMARVSRPRARPDAARPPGARLVELGIRPPRQEAEELHQDLEVDVVRRRGGADRLLDPPAGDDVDPLQWKGRKLEVAAGRTQHMRAGPGAPAHPATSTERPPVRPPGASEAENCDPPPQMQARVLRRATAGREQALRAREGPLAAARPPRATRRAPQVHARH